MRSFPAAILLSGALAGLALSAATAQRTQTAQSPGAQNRPTITARVEPDSIFIGDRFDYVVEVEKDIAQVIEFPELGEGAKGFELVASMPVDTLERDGRRLKIAKRYRIAAFEEGNYNLGVAQALYADKNIIDTLRTADSLRLQVATFLIDSTSQSIYDLKPQMGMPLRFAEIRGYLLWGLAALVLLLAAIYGLHRYLAARGRRLGDLFKPAPPLPAHVAAIRALETLHHQKLWQNGKYKAYYSALTDILRTYIAARWTIGAMEMTSDEILRAMRPENLPDKAAMDLATILQNADLVKFAKAEPDAAQNEGDYLRTYYFVEETKQADEQAQATTEETSD